MRLKLGMVSLALITSLACATGYKPKGFGGGYSHIDLAPDTFQVRFEGNDMTTRERAEDFALLRAAELALEKGYHYFILADRVDQTTRETIPMPSHSKSETKHKGGGTWQTESYGIGGGSAVSVSPNYAYTIRAFRTKPPGETLIIYDAETVQHSIRAKYGF